MQNIALIAVVGARALAKSGIASLGRRRIEARNGIREPFRINPRLRRECVDGRAAHEITGAQMMTERHRKRRHAAEAVFAQGLVIADQEGRDLLVRLGHLHHRLHEVVIGIALIDEPLALTRHRNDAGLGTVDEMRHHAARAVLAARERHRHPGGSVRQTVFHASAGGFREPQSITRVADRPGREVLGTGRSVAEHRLPPGHIVRKAAAGQHDAALACERECCRRRVRRWRRAPCRPR